MAITERILHPAYMTEGTGLAGLLYPTTITPEASRKVDKASLDVGRIVFDNSLQSLSRACKICKIDLKFDFRHTNTTLPSGVTLNIQPEYITDKYISDKTIVVSNYFNLGGVTSVQTTSAEYQSVSKEIVTFDPPSNDYIGYNGLFGLNLSMKRGSGLFSTNAYLRWLRAIVTYEQKYYARFYNEDGTLLDEQIVDGGQKPTPPEPPEKAGYSFYGWKDSRISGGVYISVRGSDETDTHYTATYIKNPTIKSSVISGKGDISPMGTVEISYGTSKTYKITPEVSDGEIYDIKDVIVDGVSQGPRESYTFENVVTNHTIEVEFSRRPEIKFNPFVNGSVFYATEKGSDRTKISESGLSVRFANDISQIYVYAEPDTGYKIKKFELNDFNVSTDSSALTNVNTGQKVDLIGYHTYTYTVEFEKIVFDMSKSTTSGGSITGPDAAEYGDDALYNIVPDDHYLITDIFLDGASALSQAIFDGNNATLSLNDVVASHSISATFKRVVYVTIDSGEKGNIYGNTIVDYDSGQEYTISADEGCSIDSIYVDGALYYKATRSENSRTIYMSAMTKDVNIRATFTYEIFEIKVTQPAEGGAIGGNAVGKYIKGSELRFYAVADNGWYMVKWNNGATDSEISFVVTEDVNLSAEFKKYNYTVVANSAGNGAVSPESISADHGDKINFTAIADKGYVFNKWEDGSIEKEREYTVENSAELTAFFKKDYFKVDSIGEGGTVEISGDAEKDGEFEFESKVTLSAIPDEGWYFVGWKANVPATSIIEIIVPAEDIVYEVKFEQYKYKVNTSSNIGGKITQGETIKHGNDFEILIENDIGYKLTDVLLDGESIFGFVTTTIDGGRYLLANVREPHSIEAVFTESRYSGRKNLIDYYPPVIQKIADFIELTNAQQPMVGRVWDAVAFAYNNQFIDDATEEGVINWEKDYGIVPAKSDTLKDRKQRLKAMWVPNSRYTYKWLVNWLKTVTGNENIKPPEIEDYSIKTQLPGDCNYFEILDNMKRYVPANMHIEPTVKLKTSQQNLYTGAAFRLKIKTQLRIEKEEVKDET